MARPKNKLCPGCNTVFRAKSDAKTCSPKCRKRLERARKALENEVQAVVHSAQAVVESVESVARKAESAVLTELSPAMATQQGFIATPSTKPTVAPAFSPAIPPAPVSIVPAEPASLVTPSLEPEQNLEVTPAAAPATFSDLFSVPSVATPPAPIVGSHQLSDPQAGAHQEPSRPFSARQALHGFNWLYPASIMLFGLIGLGFLGFMLHLKGNTSSNLQSQKDILTAIQQASASAPFNATPQNSIVQLNRNTVVSNGNSFTATGQVVIQNESDSTGAFAIQNAAGNTLLAADTKNQKVGIGTDPTGAALLQVAGDISVNGSLVSSSGAFLLSKQGLTINSALICSAAGCKSSTPAIDTSNFARLSTSQTFTGANSFNGLQVNGNLNTNGIYQSNGSTGASLTCPSSYALTSAVVAGGLTVGGVCTSITGSTTPNLQQVYNTSTPAEITLNSTNGGLDIQDAGTPLGANLFEVRSNGGATTYFAASSTGITVSGNINAIGQYQINGAQIASSNLSDSSNLAKLNGTQTFSGTNTFSNTLTAPNLTTSGASLGIGANSAALNLQGNLSSKLAATNGTNTITIGFTGIPIGNVAYNFDNTVSAGTYTICSTVGNCAGTGTGVTTSGGTTNKLAKFSASQAITNSNISDNGTTVTIQPTVNSTSSFQIQNTLGTSNLLIADTTNSRVAINQATANYALDVAGDINSTTGLRVGGTLVCTSSGCNASTGSGNYIQNGSTTQTANFNIRSSATGSVGGVIEGASGQTADILDVQSFGGTTKYLSVSTSGISVAGNINVTGQYQVGGAQISSANLSNDANLAKLNATQTFSGNNTFSGTVLSKNTVNSTAAFQVQNASGNQVLTVDSTNGQVVLGTSGGSGVEGALKFLDTASLWSVAIQSSTGHTANYTLQLPALSAGTYNICTDSGNCPGVATTLQQNYTASIGGITPEIKLDSTRGALDIQDADTTIAANLFNVRASNASGLGAILLGVGSTGQTTFQNSTNSTTAFQVQNAAGQNLVQVDSTNTNITLNGLNSGALSTWSTNAQALPQALRGATSVTANGYVYAMGGENNAGNPVSTVYYAKLNSDGSTGTWSTNAQALPQALQFATSVTANGYVYAMGGVNGVYLSTVYYAKLNSDGSTGTWSTNAQALPQGVNGPTSITANGYVYVMGGYNVSAVYYAKLNADGSTGAWSTNTNSLPQTLQFATSITANGYVYVMGGYDAVNNIYRSTVYYAKLNSDGSTGTWSTNAQALPQGLKGATSITANGYVYVMGGYNNGVYLSTVYYAKLNSDGSTGTWSTNAQALPQSLYIATSVTANGYVYFMGGWNSSNTGVSTVYYASTSRIQLGGSLDLVGLAGGTLSDPGGSSLGSSTGGSITAGNITAIGALQVQGQGSFAQGLSANGNLTIGGSTSLASNLTANGSALFQNSTNSTTAFQVQNAAGIQLFNADTSNLKLTANQVTLAVATLAAPTSPAVTAGANTGGTLSGASATTYYYKVSALNAAGESIGSTEVSINGQSFTKLAAPAAPTGVAAAGTTMGIGNYLYKLTVVTTNGETTGGTESAIIATTSGNQNVTLTLPAVPTGATGYKVYRTVVGGTTGTETLVTVGGCSGTISTATCTDSATDPQLSGALPAANTATTNTNNATVSWTTVTGATSYKVYRGTAAGAENTYQTATSSPFTDTGAAGTSGSTSVYSTAGTLGIGTTTPSASLDVVGTAIFQSQVNSTTAFQVQNTSGQNLVQVDTTNSNITLAGLNSGALSSWSTNINSMPSAPILLSSVVANGYFYVIGGRVSGTTVSTVYYAKLNADGSTGAWSTNANALPALREEQTSVAANGYVYVIGGESTSGGSSQSTVYYAKLNADGSTGTWSTNANALPQGIKEGTSIIANSYVYVIGGTNGPVQSTVYYAKLNADGSTGAWSTNANALPASRENHSSIVANGYVYVIGGDASSAGLSTVYYAKLNADGSTGTWSTNANALPQGIHNHKSVVSNGYVYAVGEVSNVSTVYYAKLNADGSTGAWSTSTNSPPIALDWPAAAIANGYIYAAGGGTTTVYYASTSRVQIGANLDLVGLQGQTLADPGDPSLGSTGGSITAGNITAVGSLQVQGQGSFAQGVGVAGNLSIAGQATFANATNSTTAFQVQNAAGNNYIQVDTSGANLYLGNTGIASTIQIGNTTGAVAQTINIGNNNTASSTTTVTIGSTIGSSAVTIQSGTGDITLSGHIKTSGASITTTVPTSCGTGAGRVQQGTDSAGLFQINAGTGTPGNCAITINFATTYSVVPSAVLLTPYSSTAPARNAYVSSLTATSFTVTFATPPPASESDGFYYWVIK